MDSRTANNIANKNTVISLVNEKYMMKDESGTKIKVNKKIHTKLIYDMFFINQDSYNKDHIILYI